MNDGQQALEAFNKAITNDSRLQALIEEIRNGRGSYAKADAAASIAGRHAGKALVDELDSAISDGSIEENVAKTILGPTMKGNHKFVADLTDTVQEKINKDAGIGLSPVRPPLNTDRINGIAKELARAEDAAAILPQIISQVENASMSIVDDAVRRNADFQYEVGRSPKIIRSGGAGCCKWCADLVGTYDYESVRGTGNDVFRRHANCNCVVEFSPGDGSRQNVHTKRMVSREEVERRGNNNQYEQDDDIIKKRKSIGIEPEFDAAHQLSRIEEYLSAEPKDVLNEAKNGGRNAGIYYQALDKSKKSLRKSIRSHIEEVVEHSEKINNPREHMLREDPDNPDAVRRAVNDWTNHRTRNADQACIEIEVWRYLYGKKD